MYILGWAVVVLGMPFRLQAWGGAFRGGSGSGFFVGLEDLCVYEGILLVDGTPVTSLGWGRI